jgi:uncharacterized LabA/DUF88 family protein
VAVFIDYQNVYNHAKRAFRLNDHGHLDGQIYPRRLGLLLTDRGRPGDDSRELERLHVYRGEPSPKHSPKGQAACQRQVRYWQSQARVEVETRPLKYYLKGHDSKGEPLYDVREKGIDVRIALDMANGAFTDQFDVAVLFSCDTDLLPALEEVRSLGKRCEVASWKSPHEYSSRVQLPKLWCHWLDETDYGRVHDPTDYTVEPPEPPSENP